MSDSLPLSLIVYVHVFRIYIFLNVSGIELAFSYPVMGNKTKLSVVINCKWRDYSHKKPTTILSQCGKRE